LDENGDFYENAEHTKIKAELARLAPAPKEPVIKESLTTEPVPEWRELGHDEEIHTGDQVQAKHHDRLHGVWLDVFPYEVGAMPIDHEAFRYRTCRLLPKQKEMPLEDELKDIDQYADRQNDFHTCRVFQSIEYSLHYLRDEIEQLKKNKK
jgi:hypothetical protein